MSLIDWQSARPDLAVKTWSAFLRSLKILVYQTQTPVFARLLTQWKSSRERHWSVWTLVSSTIFIKTP